MATPIRIKIGASLESGWDKPFTQFERRAKKAGERVQRGLMGGGGAPKREWNDVVQKVAGERRVTRETTTEAQKRVAAIRREARERAREHQQLLDEVQRAERKASRVREREAAASARTRAKAERRVERERESFARRTSHRATRFFWPNAPVMSMAQRGAADLARGAGVDTNFGSVLGRVVDSDKAARALSVKGYIQGSPGSAGQRQDAGKLREEARALGEEMGLATAEILEGQSAFVDLRGNLAGARDIARDMAKLARSQGADYRDVMYMAGKTEAMLAGQAEYAGDEEKKRRAINGLMKVAVFQAKQYSIPLDEMAKELPKLSGIASLFEGDSAANLMQLMGTAQLAEAGAAKNPATASTYTQNLALALTKKAGAFEEAGVNVFSSTERNKLRDLSEIIVDTMLATEQTRVRNVRGKGRIEQNQLQQLQTIMPDKRAALGLQAYQSMFAEAGGGQKGAEAIRKFFKDSSRGVQDTQITSDLEYALGGVEAKAQKFNQQLEKVVSAMADELIPAAEQLAPALLELVRNFGGVIQWAARNPGMAITGAIVGSIARAALESSVRQAIERVILGSMPGGGTGATPGTIPPVAPGAGKGGVSPGVATGLAALGLAAAGTEFMAYKGNRDGAKNQVGADDLTLGSVANFLIAGGTVGAAATLAGGGSLEDAAKDLSVYKAGKFAYDMFSDPTGERGANAKAKEEAQLRVQAEQRTVDQLDGVQQALRGELRVRVTNASEIGGGQDGEGGVPSAGRAPQ